jgi:hypothetical protein
MTADHKTGAVDAAATSEKPLRPTFSRYQTFVVALLAFLQFSIILDCMIISPLGAIIMPDLDIDPQRFGEIVSAYAFSAGVSGILAAGFADRGWQPLVMVFREAEFDGEVAALDITGIPQSVAQCRECRQSALSSTGIEDADHRLCRLLRPRRERPRCHATEPPSR